MTRLDTELDVHAITPQVIRRGPMAGRPALYVTLGPDLDQNYTIRSFRNQVESYNWRKRLNAPETVLVFDWMDTEGLPSDPLHKKHEAGIDAACDLFGSPEVVVNTRASRLAGEPVEQHVDHYNVDLSRHAVEKAIEDAANDKAVDWLARISRSASDQTAAFRIDLDAKSQEGDIQRFSSRYHVPDGNIWLVPTGDNVESVRTSTADAELLAKRNFWNLSPRLALMEDGGD